MCCYLLLTYYTDGTADTYVDILLRTVKCLHFSHFLPYFSFLLPPSLRPINSSVCWRRRKEKERNAAESCVWTLNQIGDDKQQQQQLSASIRLQLLSDTVTSLCLIPLSCFIYLFPSLLKLVGNFFLLLFLELEFVSSLVSDTEPGTGGRKTAPRTRPDRVMEILDCSEPFLHWDRNLSELSEAGELDCVLHTNVSHRSGMDDGGGIDQIMVISCVQLE